jgi:hypothetical protein
MIRKKGSISETDGIRIDRYLGKIAELTEKLDTLEF